MYKSLQDTVELNNGVKMPVMGLGVFKVEDGTTVVESVKAAIKNGYRSIDTASIYGNEIGVGQGIKESGVPREELFITSKVWNSDHGFESTLAAYETTLEKMGLEYLDLYLIHWPGQDKYVETWKALEKLYKDGKVRAIGVSNFHIHHLENILEAGEFKPVINQVEYHPHLSQVELREFCEKENIQLEAWSPLKKGELLKDAEIQRLAEKHKKTPAQIILRWDIQNNVITIPKSIKEHRIIENADIFDFSLDAEDIEAINALNINDRSGSDPDAFIF
ncbi:aldo/keto reductase [Planococcus sp. MERTA32b]|nr:aldo/keto reductase [Planococcus sp. MER TA 32b]